MYAVGVSVGIVVLDCLGRVVQYIALFVGGNVSFFGEDSKSVTP